MFAFESIPIVQRIERGFPKAKQALLPVSALLVRRAQGYTRQPLVTTSVSSAVIQNALIFRYRVTQRVTHKPPLVASGKARILLTI
jgi:hypothetical protein